MKTLLLFPLFIFLIMGINDTEAANNDTIIDDSLKIFANNKEILEDEIEFGEICLLILTETGDKDDEICNIYHITREAASDLTNIGLDIFEELYNSGILVENKESYFKIIDIIERLVIVERKAKVLRRKIDIVSGAGCIKCAM